MSVMPLEVIPIAYCFSYLPTISNNNMEDVQPLRWNKTSDTLYKSPMVGLRGCRKNM